MSEELRTGEAAAREHGSAEPGPLGTLLVALAVCGFCAAVLTASVVVLRPYQLENRQRARAERVRSLVAELPGVSELMGPLGEGALEVRVVELATGRYAPEVDPEPLLLGAGDDPQGRPLPPERDPAGVGRVPRYAVVYLLRRDGAIHSLILPVSGQGYLSTIRGYLALAGDGNTVRGIAFTEHEETPGLGAEIENPAWRSRWEGRRLRDADGRVRIRVVPAAAPAGSPEGTYAVEGISGATRTSEGVSALVRFWAGPDGFGPYLERIREGGEDG